MFLVDENYKNDSKREHHRLVLLAISDRNRAHGLFLKLIEVLQSLSYWENLGKLSDLFLRLAVKKIVNFKID